MASRTPPTPAAVSCSVTKARASADPPVTLAVLDLVLLPSTNVRQCHSARPAPP
jgi:hypothetical protein